MRSSLLALALTVFAFPLAAQDTLAALPAAQRDAVSARVLEDREYAEIASSLRTSESVVRKRVSRGLAGLRDRMGEEAP